MSFSLSTSQLLCIFILVNTFAAFTNHIDDTDEVYGYYEPLHYLLFSTGMQTWEYAPQYALRSYAFLAPLYLVGGLLRDFTSLSKVEIFYSLRVCIGCFYAYCESQFVYTAAKQLDIPFALPIMTMLFILSPGIFYSSTSFLPSAFCASFLMLAFTSWSKDRKVMMVFWGSLAAIWTGWPFCCLLFLPFGIDALLHSRTLHIAFFFCLQSLLILITVLLACTLIDGLAYRRFTSPPFNILLYNAIGGRGDELYGVEPASYYIRNLFLTMGLCWPLAATAPLLMLHQIISKTKENIFRRSTVVISSSFILWLVVLFRRPHKVILSSSSFRGCLS